MPKRCFGWFIKHLDRGISCGTSVTLQCDFLNVNLFLKNFKTKWTELCSRHHKPALEHFRPDATARARLPAPGPPLTCFPSLRLFRRLLTRPARRPARPRSGLFRPREVRAAACRRVSPATAGPRPRVCSPAGGHVGRRRRGDSGTNKYPQCAARKRAGVVTCTCFRFAPVTPSQGVAASQGEFPFHALSSGRGFPEGLRRPRSRPAVSARPVRPRRHCPPSRCCRYCIAVINHYYCYCCCCYRCRPRECQVAPRRSFN